jgi:hypothetical protein
MLYDPVNKKKETYSNFMLSEIFDPSAGNAYSI